MSSLTLDQVIKNNPKYYWDITGVIIIAIDADGIIRLINRYGCEVLGYNMNEIIGNNWFDEFIPKKSKQNSKESFKLLIEGNIDSNDKFENLVIDKNGEYRLVSWHNSLVRDENNKIIGTISSGEDITERRKLEHLLKVNEKKYRTFFDNMSSGFAIHQIVTDDQGAPIDYIYLEVNNAFEDLTGLKRNDIIGKKVTQAIPNIKKSNFDWIGTFGKVALTGGKIRIENQYEPILKRWYTVNAYCLEKGIFATAFLDVTFHKKVEIELRETNERLSLALKSGNQGVFDINIQTGEANVSQEYTTMLGFDPSTFKETIQSLVKRMHPHDVNYSKKVLQELIEGKRTEHSIEFRLKTFDGNWKWILSMGKIIKYDDQNKPLRIIGTHTDIDDFKKVQFKLEESLNFTEAALNTQRDTFFVFDPTTGKAIRWNKVFEEISEYSAEEISKLEAPESYYSKDDLEKVAKVISEVYKEGYAKTDISLITKSGKKILTEYVVTSIKDVKGNPKCFISIGRDVSERKKTEILLKEKTEEIERQNEEYISLNNDLSEKIEEINTINKELSSAKERAEESDYLKSAFLSNMSHEIRTPMNAILGFSKLMSKKQLSQSKTKKYTEFIQNSGEQLLRIIDDIIDISKIESNQLRIEKKSCNLNKLLKEIAASERLISLMKKKINVKLKLNLPDNTDELHMYTDPIRFKQILSNLITNAFKFTDTGFVEIGCSIMKENNNEFVQFYVKDTGIGISKEKFDNIFERFGQIRDEKVRGGTGLGLSITKGIVELLGGKIWLESKIYKGSIFFFTLPLEQNVSADSKEDLVDISFTLPDLSQKIAYVAEDDITSFLFIKEILKETKIKIVHAQHGLELLKFIEKRIPDVILLDLNMPVMSGYEALINIRKNYHNIPIIAQTAYAMPEEKEKCLKLGADDYIVKPIEPEELLQKVVKQLKVL